MEDEILRGLENFNAVWQRVTESSGAEKKQSEAERMTLLLGLESELGTEISALAPRLGRGRLYAIDHRYREHIRFLQLEYFLLTGNVFEAAPKTAEKSGVMSELRKIYIDERKLANSYALASAESEEPGLRTFYLKASDEGKTSAVEIKSILSDMMK